MLELVTRWRQDTKVKCRPHAKAPGSKSHSRYEKYSKAKTVGQSLALGSYPKVLHGHIREEPRQANLCTRCNLEKWQECFARSPEITGCT